MTKGEFFSWDISHYNQGSIECIDAIESALEPRGFEAFLRGQVIKYTWRLGLKNSAIDDAKKARWYAQRLIDHAEKWTKEDIKVAT